MIPAASAIVPYRPEFAEDFARLNREWLERDFTIEPRDEDYLGDPEGRIIAHGGEVFFALQSDVVVGTCAAIPLGDGEFELAKLCVTPSAQGSGLGRALAQAVVDFARSRGASRLTLVSSSRLQSALRLYERLGFERRPFPGAPPYIDADVYMEMDFADRMSSPLDEFIPRPDARERFEIVVNAPADVVMAAAQGFDMQSIPLVRAIFSLRAWLTRATRVARVPQPLMTEMRALGWGILRQDQDRLVIAGAICQPWQANVRFRSIPVDDFRSHHDPEHVKIAWTLETIPVGRERTRLASETRAVATDEAARTRFLRYWRWARFGIVPIRWLLLPAVRRRAEREWQRGNATT